MFDNGFGIWGGYGYGYDEFETVKETLKQRVARILYNTGYPDYALALNGFVAVKELTGERNIGQVSSDGCLYLNSSLTDEQLGLVARHEILHILLKHKSRCPKSIKSRQEFYEWNCACDLELSNYYSVHDNKKIRGVGSILHDGLSVADEKYADYRNMTAKKIFEKIQENKKRKQQQQTNADDNQSDPSNQDNDESPAAPKTQDEQQNNQQNKQDNEQPEDDFTPSNPFDDGENEEDEQGQQGSSSSSEQSILDDDSADEFEQPADQEEQHHDGNFDPEKELVVDNQITSEQEAALINSIRRAVSGGYDMLDEEQQHIIEQSEVVKSIGCSGIGDRVKEIEVTPAMQTRIEVRKLYNDMKAYFIDQEHVEKSRTYKRPNKKYCSSKIVMRGRSNVHKPSKTICAYVDVSGSMSYNDVKKGIEIAESLKKIKNLEVIVKYFNTRIHDEFRVGGGTDYTNVLDHAKENGYNCIAIITDDSSEYFGDRHWDLEALWLIGIEKPYRKSGEYFICRNIKSAKHTVEEGCNENITAKKFKFSVILPDPV